MTLSSLRVALRDPDARVRAQAARAIGYIGPEAAEAIPDLLEMIAEGVSAQEAIDALREMGDVAEEALRTINHITHG